MGRFSENVLRERNGLYQTGLSRLPFPPTLYKRMRDT